MAEEKTTPEAPSRPTTYSRPRPSGGGRSSQGQRRGGPRRRYVRRRRLCQFCAEKVRVIDYKQKDLLKRFVNEQGKIRPRRETGACAKHQRVVSKAIKRARHMALLPFAADRFR